MAKILRELKKVTNNIIFATTTPVRPKNPNQKNEIITEYNKCIVDFMNKQGVIINDLNALVSENTDEYLCNDNIHLSERGKEKCAKQIAKYVKEVCDIKIKIDAK